MFTIASIHQISLTSVCERVLDEPASSCKRGIYIRSLAAKSHVIHTTYVLYSAGTCAARKYVTNTSPGDA